MRKLVITSKADRHRYSNFGGREWRSVSICMRCAGNSGHVIGHMPKMAVTFLCNTHSEQTTISYTCTAVKIQQQNTIAQRVHRLIQSIRGRESGTVLTAAQLSYRLLLGYILHYPSLLIVLKLVGISCNDVI